MQMEETGFYEHYAKGVSLDDFPPVVTVFSAPEYCNVYSNMVRSPLFAQDNDVCA